MIARDPPLLRPNPARAPHRSAARPTLRPGCVAVALRTLLILALGLSASLGLAQAPAGADPTPAPLGAAPPAAPAAMLALRYDASIDPAAYWVSEKLDGVRALWDGQRLRFRSGRELVAPTWFLAALPATAVDGELWLGRRRFDELSGLIRREDPQDPAWLALPAADARAETDAWLAEHLTANIDTLTPRSLSPLPLLGIPGVTPDNECAAYYRDTRQFRPRRGTTPSAPPT